MSEPRFFATPEAFGRWLRANHTKKTEQWIGFYKTNSGKKSITWPESVDEALCVGWIDGLRKSIDDESYTIRFTPRMPSIQPKHSASSTDSGQVMLALPEPRL